MKDLFRPKISETSKKIVKKVVKKTGAAQPDDTMEHMASTEGGTGE